MGVRIGFDVTELDEGANPIDDSRGTLSRANLNGKPPKKGTSAVGKYVVDVESFERVAIPALTRALKTAALRSAGDQPLSLVAIDEVGKMESFSHEFLPLVDKLLDTQSVSVLATIPTPRYGKTLPYVERLRAREDVLLLKLTKNNRDEATRALGDAIDQALSDGTDHYDGIDSTRLEAFLDERPVARTTLSKPKRATPVLDKTEQRDTATKVNENCQVSHEGCACLMPTDASPRALLLGKANS